MKITFEWLKDHLKTSFKEKHLLEKLTNIGLEVESVGNLSAENALFKIAKIIKLNSKIFLTILVKLSVIVLKKYTKS